MLNVHHDLSESDSAKAKDFAQQIQQCAPVVDRLRIARLGMDIFQQQPISMEQEYAYIVTLHRLGVVGLSEYLNALWGQGPRLRTVQFAIALNVHFLAIGRPLEVQQND